MDRNPKHPPRDPETEKLPVEPEMQPGLDPQAPGGPGEIVPPEEKPNPGSVTP